MSAQLKSYVLIMLNAMTQKAVLSVPVSQDTQEMEFITAQVCFILSLLTEFQK